MSATTHEKAQHTPGPWLYIKSADKRMDGYIRKPLAPVADEENKGRVYGPAICKMCGTVPVDEREANAQLIASAPELKAQVAELTAQRDALLEACKTLVNRFGYTTYDITCMAELEQAQRAIAQATGNGQ